MAVLDQNIARGESFLSRLATRFFNAMDPIMESNSRVREVRYYESLTDAELKKLGLTRDQIVLHVFRDKLC